MASTSGAPMFDLGHDQAAGLRGTPAHGGPVLMPVASPAQPARAYEVLCTLAVQLEAIGRCPVILDGSAGESPARRDRGGAHLGLLHALQDPSIAHLERPAGEGGDWLVMPAARGLQALQQTARAAGAQVALSRLLSPFADSATVLLFAPATTIAALFGGLEARVLVPVINQPQSSIDAYGALKLLLGAGLSPVLAPLPEPDGAVPLQKVVDTVADCAQRHLDSLVEIWASAGWGLRVQECALGRPLRQDRSAATGLRLNTPDAPRASEARFDWS